MTLNRKKSTSDLTPDELGIYAARLGYIGSCISTLGGGLSTIAAGIALQALVEASDEGFEGFKSQSDPDKESEIMQNQIDYLIDELKHMKKLLGKK